MDYNQTEQLFALDYVLWDLGASKLFRDSIHQKIVDDLQDYTLDRANLTLNMGIQMYGDKGGGEFQAVEGLHHEPTAQDGDINISKANGDFLCYVQLELWNHKTDQYSRDLVTYTLGKLFNNCDPQELSAKAQADYDYFGLGY